MYKNHTLTLPITPSSLEVDYKNSTKCNSFDASASNELRIERVTNCIDRVTRGFHIASLTFLDNAQVSDSYHSVLWWTMFESQYCKPLHDTVTTRRFHRYHRHQKFGTNYRPTFPEIKWQYFVSFLLDVFLLTLVSVGPNCLLSQSCHCINSLTRFLGVPHLSRIRWHV